jgi:hypothetical protein
MSEVHQTIPPGDHHSLAQLQDEVTKNEAAKGTLYQFDYTLREWEIIVSLTATQRRLKSPENFMADSFENTDELNELPSQDA